MAHIPILTSRLQFVFHTSRSSYAPELSRLVSLVISTCFFSMWVKIIKGYLYLYLLFSAVSVSAAPDNKYCSQHILTLTSSPSVCRQSSLSFGNTFSLRALRSNTLSANMSTSSCVSSRNLK